MNLKIINNANLSNLGAVNVAAWMIRHDLKEAEFDGGIVVTYRNGVVTIEREGNNGKAQ